MRHSLDQQDIEVPSGWTAEHLVDRDTLVLLSPLGPGDEFRANVVLTVTDTAGWSFADWQRSTEAELPMVLADYLLLDQQKLEIAGRPAGRRLAHHTTPEGVAVTMEQWFVLIEGKGYTLTFTASDLDYPENLELLEETVASWRPGARDA